MTFAELHSIIKSFQRRDQFMWNHTASFMALYYNSLRGKSNPALSAEDFNPYSEKNSSQGNAREQIKSKEDVDKLVERLKNF